MLCVEEYATRKNIALLLMFPVDIMAYWLRMWYMFGWAGIYDGAKLCCWGRDVFTGGGPACRI